jgi:hypothetical protein
MTEPEPRVKALNRNYQRVTLETRALTVGQMRELVKRCDELEIKDGVAVCIPAAFNNRVPINGDIDIYQERPVS